MRCSTVTSLLRSKLKGLGVVSCSSGKRSVPAGFPPQLFALCPGTPLHSLEAAVQLRDWEPLKGGTVPHSSFPCLVLINEA